MEQHTANQLEQITSRTLFRNILENLRENNYTENQICIQKMFSSFGVSKPRGDRASNGCANVSACMCTCGCVYIHVSVCASFPFFLLVCYLGGNECHNFFFLFTRNFIFSPSTFNVCQRMSRHLYIHHHHALISETGNFQVSFFYNPVNLVHQCTGLQANIPDLGLCCL